MESQNKSSKKLGLVFAVAVVIIGIVSIAANQQAAPLVVTQTDGNSVVTSTSSSNAASNTPKIPNPPPADIPKKTVSVYKNGNYSATGSYMSPGGQDQLGVTLTLTNDIITNITITPGAQDHTSARYQDIFIANYKQFVVGKNIADVNLSNVSGSSLTPIGFNNALSQIKAQAKV